MPAHCVSPVLAAIDVIENEPELVERLWDVTERMRKGLNDLGSSPFSVLTLIAAIFVPPGIDP